MSERYRAAAIAVLSSSTYPGAMAACEGYFSNPALKFYALAWALEERALKVYFGADTRDPIVIRLVEMTAARDPSLARLLRSRLVDGTIVESPTTPSADIFEPGKSLLSVTLVARPSGKDDEVGSYCVHEEKAYLFPTDEAMPAVLALPEHSPYRRGSVGLALMCSSRRGLVSQYDVAHVPEAREDGEEAWLEALTEPGRDIVRKYHGVGMPLDTVSVEGPDDYTIYVPFQGISVATRAFRSAF